MDGATSYRLVAIKCDSGYIKSSAGQIITDAPLAQASVFAPEQTAALEALWRQLSDAQVPGLRKVLLHIREEELD